MAGTLRRTSISLPEDVLEKGQRLAKGRRRNFSNYIADLIASDFEKNGGDLKDPPARSIAKSRRDGERAGVDGESSSDNL